MEKRLVEVIDIDGSGLYALRRVLMRGFRVAYFSPTLDSSLTRRLSRTASGLRHKNVIIKALSNGTLRQLRSDSEIGGAGILIVSRILSINESFSEREFLELHKKVAKKLRKGSLVVNTGISPPGLTEEVLRVLANHSQDFQLYYLAHPALTGPQPPLGGEASPHSREILKALTGRGGMIEGLSYREAELLAVTLLLRHEALAAVGSESSILAKRYGVSPPKLLTSLGGGISLPCSSRLRAAILRYLEGLEREALGFPGVAERSAKLSSLMERDITSSLRRSRGDRRGVSILVVGSREPLKMLERLPSRSFKISYLSSGRFLERIGSLRGVPRHVRTVILASKNRTVRDKARDLYHGRARIIDLNRYLGDE